MSKSKEARTFWSQHVSAWEQSGLSAGAYGAQHGVEARTLGVWRRKLRDEGKGHGTTGAAGPSFIEVGLGAVRSEAAFLELVSPTGWTIRVPPGFDASEVSQLVTAGSGVAW